MTLIKQNLVPIVIILAAGLIVSFAAVPLENSEWAESIRAESSAGGEEEGLDGEGELPNGAVLVILPLIKVTILMGIGAGLTAFVLRLIRTFRSPTGARETTS